MASKTVMSLRRGSIPAVVAVVLALSGAGLAQEWRGMGRVAGKVTDEQGNPIEGVTVKAMLPSSSNRGPEVKSNRKGDWAIAGIARGDWALDFVKEGYETKSISVSISETSRIPPVEVQLVKAAPKVDPNQEIKEKLTRASTLMTAKQFAEARAIYEELSSRYPEVKQFQPLIARTYYGEGNKAKAIEHLRAASEKDPENVEVTLLLGNVLMEEGQTAEGKKILESIDESRVTDPTIYLNVGIGMINEGKHAEAVTWFDKAIARFPEHPDAYYYRGISYLSLNRGDEAKADLEKFVATAPADAPELVTAKKILETLK
jgi:tetratricopeptide (TPR) repeat protein